MEGVWDIRHNGRLDIDWSVIEKQVQKQSNLIHKGKIKGKKLRLDISMNYLTNDNGPT